MDKLKVDKNTLELSKIEEGSEGIWNYGHFKAGSFIIKHCQQTGQFLDKVACTS
ncbi:hypothetical protein [Clostridium lundense]|uniref:hypothetical protein n=1 Tax=Clostridium lundense TaxID=319475 RepID=UPI000AB60960|nr:hypothetical protein [Clostridium lundense]